MSTASSFEHEYRAASEAVGLLDRSERGKLALGGQGAKEFLQGQLTQDILALTPGHGAYAAFLTPKGKMLGDVRVLDAEHEILLDTERVALQALFNMIHRYRLGYDVQLHKRTLESGLYSLVGPLADELIASAGGSVGAAEHDHALLSLGGLSARAIRTDLGLDLLFDAQHAGAVREALLAAGATAIGEQAAETLRIERGRPRYGVDLDESVIPQEAGLNERAVSFTKGCYVGQETVARLFYKGHPNRQLRGLRSTAALAPASELQLDGRIVGTVTSAALSPRLGPIGLALVRREAPPGSTVLVGPGHEAVISELPFL